MKHPAVLSQAVSPLIPGAQDETGASQEDTTSGNSFRVFLAAIPESRGGG